MKKHLQAILILFLLSGAIHAQNQYKTIAAGNWSLGSTWSSVPPYDGVPPYILPSGHTIEINHRVIYNLGNDLEINGSVFISGDTLRFQNDGTAGTGRSIFVKNTGYLEVVNGGLIMPLKTTSNSNNNGNIVNQGGRTVYFKSYAEIAQNWESENSGRRKFTNSCLKLGENYLNKNSTDTLHNVCIELGLHGSGNFENDGGIIRLNTTSILLKGTSGNFSNKSGSSDILTYLSPAYAIHALYVPGNLENVGDWIAPINKYCVNGSISGSQSGQIDFTSPEDCPWFATNNACVDCSANNIPLPVNFKTFTAVRNQSTVALRWETMTEQNNTGFAVERNTGSGWEQVAFVPSGGLNGNSNSLLTYTYSDLNPFKGISQYRIRQVDFDNRSTTTEIKAVRGMNNKTQLFVYPNPSIDGKVNVVFEDASAIRDVTLSDMAGRVVKQLKGVTNNNIQFENLFPGMYSLRVIDRETGEQNVQKIVVNKR